MTASHIDLFTIDDNGQFQLASAGQVIEAALAILDEKVMRNGLISAPADASAFFSLRLGSLEHEVFAAIFLDAQNRVIEYIELFRGTLTQTSVYPREVVKTSLRLNAAAVIVVFRRRLHEISGVGCTARTGRLQGSVESGFSYLEACGGLADIQAVGDKLPRSLQLVGSDNRLASAFAPACGGSGQPGLGALADQVALELAQRTEHMEDEPPARRGGVDVFSQRAEADAPLRAAASGAHGRAGLATDLIDKFNKI